MNTKTAMIELIRLSLCDNYQTDRSLMETDWDGLLDVASNHGVLAIIWDGICKSGLDKQLTRQQKINWGLSVQDIFDKYDEYRKVLSKVVEKCNQNHIRLLLLKGVSLSELYPSPASRPAGDIDFFLFGDYEKGNIIFSEKNDYHETVLHSEIYYQNVLLENHKMIVFPNSKVKKNVNDYLMQNLDRVRKHTIGYYQFQPLQYLPYLIIHSVNHLDFQENSPLLPIRHMVDIGLFINRFRTDLPGDSVIKIMESLGLGKAFRLIIELAEILLKLDLSEYKKNDILEKDLIFFNWLINNAMEYPINRSISHGKQIMSIMRRYHNIKKILPYFPINPQRSLLRITMTQIIKK